ncbi:MAG: autotransporter outer membrane beta-barrel domain-containing protein [Gammaproteobacteria bacterium]|nr:autotransporter outer membrane beta-barrel domain-containing protein [Gammaproteobacteria bacterium]
MSIKARLLLATSLTLLSASALAYDFYTTASTLLTEPLKQIANQPTEFISGDTLLVGSTTLPAFAVGDKVVLSVIGGATFADAAYSLEVNLGGAGTGELTLAVLQTGATAGATRIEFLMGESTSMFGMPSPLATVPTFILSGATIAGQRINFNLPANPGTDITMKFELFSSTNALKGSATHVLFKSTVPTVTIKNAPAAVQSKAPFNVSFEWSEAVSEFTASDVTVVNAAISAFTQVSTSLYTATITPDGLGDITLDIAAGVAKDVTNNTNGAATQVKVAFQPPAAQTPASNVVTAQQTQQAVNNQLGNHARNLAAQGVGLSGLVTGHGFGGEGIRGFLGQAESLMPHLESAVGGPVPLSLTVNNSSNQFSGEFALSFASLERWYRDLSASARDGASQPIPEQSEPAMSAAANLWMKGRWSQIHDERGGGDSESDFAVIYFGGDFRVGADTRVGVMGQVDWFDERATGSNPDGEGRGWMVGPYVVSRLDEHLIVDARAAMGQSDNKISPIGTYTDDYDTTRWQLETNLTGQWTTSDWDILPSVGISYFEERQHAYTDSNGQRISGQTVSIGSVNFGPTVYYNLYRTDGTVIRPMLGLKGIWQFKAPTQYDVRGNGIRTERLSAQAKAGVQAITSQGTAFTGSYTYDGIGIAHYRAHAIEVGVSTPLHWSVLPRDTRLNAAYSFNGQQRAALDSEGNQQLSVEMAVPFD